MYKATHTDNDNVMIFVVKRNAGDYAMGYKDLDADMVSDTLYIYLTLAQAMVAFNKQVENVVE